MNRYICWAVGVLSAFAVVFICYHEHSSTVYSPPIDMGVTRVEPLDPKTAINLAVEYEIKEINYSLAKDSSSHMIQGTIVAHKVADAFRAKGWIVEVLDTDHDGGYAFLKFKWPAKLQ